jgi:feruloyl-CoA synthase
MHVRAIAQALLGRKLAPERPIVILSGNDLEHAMLGLAAMMIGVPYAPISVPYSLMSTDFGKLKSIMETLTPGLVFAASGKAFSRAIEATVPQDIELVVTGRSRRAAGHTVRRTAGGEANQRGRPRARQGRA